MFAASTTAPAITWAPILFVGAALFVLIQAVRGWRAGVMRRIVSILALVFAFLAATIERDRMVPLLRPWGLPDRYLSFIGGILLGTAIYAVVMVIAAIIFKKTSQQDVGLVRVSYGFLGALI